MTIVLGNASALRDAVARGLEAAGHTTTVIAPDHEDPYAESVNHDAVVYVPDSPDREQAKIALSASHAPGVGVLVAVMPLDGYDEVAQLVKRDGKPYVLLRRPPLLEELATSLDGRRLVVVPRDETQRALAEDELVAAVADAIRTEEHGEVRELGEALPRAEALRRAAARTGRRTWVMGLWRPLARALAWLAALAAPRRPALPAAAR